MSIEISPPHTATPWHLDGHDLSSIIHCTVERGNPEATHVCGDYENIAKAAGENWKANAAFIVKAVNAHDDLVSALREARDRLRYDGDLFIDQSLHSRAEASFTAMDACDTALAKVSS